MPEDLRLNWVCKQVRKSKNPFNYYVRGNFGYATNKIVKVDEAENIPSYWSAIGRPVGLQANGTSMNGNGFLQH